MNKNIIIVLFILIGISFGLIISFVITPPFSILSLTGMHNRILGYRGLAIEKAKKAGIYNCCYEPGCTMCFMEGNKWNNNTPGTCACTDLIARGESPCPQCERALEKEKGETCDLNEACQM